LLYSELNDNFSKNNQQININVIKKYYFLREKSKKINSKVKSLTNSFVFFVQFYNTYEFIFKDDLVEAIKYWICLSKEEKQNFVKNIIKAKKKKRSKKKINS
jgi:hypothetical protein